VISLASVTANNFTIEAKPVGISSCNNDCMRLIANGTFTEF
jgi:hypothetical protein